jgi:DNA-binding CsgD family transcriptional regulator
MDDGDLEELVESVYDLALEPDQWPQLLRRVAGAFGAHAGSITQENMESGEGGGLTLGLAPEVPGLYFGHYATRNVLRRLAKPRELMKDFRPTITVDEETLPKRALMKSEFYVDFLRPAGIHSVMTVGLWARGVEFAGVDLFRPLGRPGFSAQEVRLAQALHPHLIRAFRLGRKVAETRELGEAMAAALDRSPYGLFILGDDGRVRHANAAGERLLGEPGGLRAIFGRLSAPSPDDSRRLQRLIAAACGAAGPRVGGTMAVRRPGERAPLSVVVAPTRERAFSVLPAGPSVIVCVTDPEAAAGVPESLLRELFDLTSAQAKVAAALIAGRSPRQAAEALGLSFYTVRAHLARIFEKTGAHRQSELVALMTRALGAQLG